MIGKTNFIIYVGSTNECIDGFFKIINKDLSNEIQIGKTENDDFYYLNLLNENKCRDKVIISTTTKSNIDSSNKQQKQIFRLNTEYNKLIEHILKDSCFEKPRSSIENTILRILSNYKIYIKLKNLTYFSFHN